ncbi:MAG: hypothetical protein LAT67_10810 [Balneolales bacterium]|nr:hypothetical protein [Balneolales bacterium]
METGISFMLKEVVFRQKGIDMKRVKKTVTVQRSNITNDVRCQMSDVRCQKLVILKIERTLECIYTENNRAFHKGLDYQNMHHGTPFRISRTLTLPWVIFTRLFQKFHLNKKAIPKQIGMAFFI